jgi:hypothetical protein
VQAVTLRGAAAMDEAMELHDAAEDGDVVMIRTLVEQGADIEAEDEDGLSRAPRSYDRACVGACTRSEEHVHTICRCSMRVRVQGGRNL